MNDIKELDEGSVIGNYRVVRLLGQGGMGTVYEVEHVELGVHYALKTFTFDSSNECAEILKTKFLEEGKVLARLKHPNVAHVFDLAFDEKTQMPYFVMDLVTYSDGESYTAEDVDQNDITEGLVYEWFSQLASALDYIHGEGIVHRDIKPSNLLLDKDLHVVLTDFGISRIFGGKIKSDVEAQKTMVTKTGRGKLVLGTEKYMAPEVAEGEDATPQADAYSLGVMVIRWLTGFFYSDNPGAISLLPRGRFRWLPVVAQLVAPAGRRPEKYAELVKQLKIVPSPDGKKKGGAARPEKRRRKRDFLRTAFTLVFWLAVVGAGSWFGYQGWRAYEYQRQERYELLQRQQADLARRLQESNEANEKDRAEAEQRRIAEEKRRAEEKRKAEERRKKAEEERVEITPSGEKVKVKGEGEQSKVQPDKEKRTFEDEGGVARDEKDYGPIPNRKYTWLRGGNVDAPIPEKFLLANGAVIELMPQKAATFYMTNEEGDPKRWHEVTLTRPFWMSKSCVTVDQWREFAPNDCEDCREVEKALNGQALLYIRLNRKSIDDYCAYLTAKYRVKLPKGYVFRLPTEAEWEYVMDFEAVYNKWERYNDKWWGENVSIGGAAVRERFTLIRNRQNVLQQIREDTWWEGHRYRVGGLAMPTPSGIYDMFGEWRWMLDRCPRGQRLDYADKEEDPLRWLKGMNVVLGRDWERRREGRGEGDQNLCHIVLGPDLIGEKAWENKRENVEVKANVPNQKAKFEPKKIPNKISKPREVVLRRVGWKVGATDKEMVFCEIPKGKFNMSNVDGQAKQYHKVELTKPFWMSKFLVTSEEWREYAPADFNTRAVKAAEKLFPKNPVCVNNPYHRWTAYCEFLTQRYGNLLPPGYVFRLPTEAEWEWAFIADEKGDVRRMQNESFNNECDCFRRPFEDALRKAHAPKELRYDSKGIIGNAYIGGRTFASGFGVRDIVVQDWCRTVVVLDNFDTCGRINDKGEEDRFVADAVANIVYEEKEIDPVRWAGRNAARSLTRSISSRRALFGCGNWAYAHIVIAPDILKPLKEKEVAEFPKEDFGGVFLGACVTRADQSSMLDKMNRNSEKQFKRLVSRENVIVARLDKGEDTRGFHTQREDAPWIMLDLGKVRKITGLAIDGFSGATRNLCVWGSNDGKRRTLLDKEELERKRYRIDLQNKNANFRYLIIGREPGAQKNLWFYLDKIVIYGKEK